MNRVIALCFAITLISLICIGSIVMGHNNRIEEQSAEIDQIDKNYQRVTELFNHIDDSLTEIDRRLTNIGTSLDKGHRNE